MSIRQRVALAFLAILVLFALNIVVYFDGIGKRNASFEYLNQAVERQLLVIDLQRQTSSLADVVRNLDLIAKTDSESARIEPGQADEKTQELASLAQMAQRLYRLSQSQPGASLEGFESEPLELEAALQVSNDFVQLEDIWGRFFHCLAVPVGEPIVFSTDDGSDAAETLAPEAPPTDSAAGRDDPATPRDGAAEAAAAEGGDPALPDNTAGSPCPNPQLSLAETISLRLGDMETAERQQVEAARFLFSEVAGITNRRILLIFAVSTLVAVVVALLFSSYLSRGLTALKSGARRIGQGDLEYRIPERGQDELAELAHAFNDMSSNLLAARSKVEEARAAAEEANHAKSTFLANMSHELRTPMNAIIGYSEMLIEEAEDLEQGDVVPDLQRILAASNHLLALINDVLDLSKIEAGKMTLFLEDFRVASMIDDVTATIKPLVAKNDNRLDVQLAPGLGILRADETKVRQTLFNLLSNACKFTSEGTISLGVERYPTTGGDHLRFQVHDTGIGMSPEQMARIFDEFTQADSSTTRKFGGTGLGLTISKRFCQLMGGDLTVASAQGSGTTFTVDLPAVVTGVAAGSDTSAAGPAVVVEPSATGGAFSDGATEIMAAAEGDRNSTPATATEKTILVVDDDVATLDLTRRFLERDNDFRVVTSNNGAEGLRLARQLLPEAIVLDIMMPQMDGWQVLAELQADDTTRHIPVLMISMLDEQEMGYALGASDYLNKPLNRERLASHLQRLAGRTDRAGSLLVVDDDPAARDLLRRGCQREGWEVREAENGLVALGMLADELPDFILLDLAMPQMNGFEFLEELRHNDETADLPVVVITASDLEPEERQRLSGQVEAVLKKGTSRSSELLAELKRRLG